MKELETLDTGGCHLMNVIHHTWRHFNPMYSGRKQTCSGVGNVGWSYACVLTVQPLVVWPQESTRHNGSSVSMDTVATTHLRTVLASFPPSLLFFETGSRYIPKGDPEPVILLPQLPPPCTQCYVTSVPQPGVH